MKISERQLLMLLSIVEGTITNSNVCNYQFGRMSLSDRVALLNTIRNQSEHNLVNVGSGLAEVAEVESEIKKVDWGCCQCHPQHCKGKNCIRAAGA